jgi:hypothetical protein
MGYTNLIPPSDNYVANTFMVTLSTNFHSGMGGAKSNQYTGYGGSMGAGLGSFGGYRAGQGFSSYNTYGTYGNYGTTGGYYTGGSPYGSSYNAFDSLQSGSGSQSQYQQLPGYGIFDQSQQQTSYRTRQDGQEVGLGEFKARDADEDMDALRPDGPPRPGEKGALGEPPEWLNPEDYWDYWPLGFWHMGL